MTWKPHVTVAAVIERNNHFLLVEEQTSKGIAFNQPAGHLEPGEDLLTAIKREVQEETAYCFNPEHLLSIQLWRGTPAMPTFLRICFIGSSHSHNPGQALDKGIIDAHWLTREQIVERHQQLRSPLVLTTIDQYLAGEQHPLSLLKSFLDITE